MEVVDNQLSGTAADVHDKRPGLRVDAAPRELSLFVAAHELRREAIAPLDLAEECFPVLGVAHGTRRDRECSLRAETLERPAVVGERVPHAGDRKREEAAPCVDAFAEPGDAGLAVHLVDAAVVDVRNEQPCGVRAEVDRRDSHLRG